MSINYTLHFGRGMSIALKHQACFIFLKDFESNLSYQYNIDYSDESSPKLKNLEFFLTEEEQFTVEDKHFFSYLYKKYSLYLVGDLEGIYTRKSIIINGDCPSKLAYVILSFFRFYIEDPHKITSFYKLKDVKNRDLAFLTSVCVNSAGFFARTNHSPILDMSMCKIKSFITGKWEEKYNLKVNPDYREASYLFSIYGDHGVKLAECMKDSELSERYNCLEKKYEEYISTVEQQLRKTVQTRRSESSNSKKVGRSEEWCHALFGEEGVP